MAATAARSGRGDQPEDLPGARIAIFRRREAEARAERRREVAVAAEAKVERKAGDAVAVGEFGERAAEPQAPLIAIERDSLRPREFLGEIDRRNADLLGNFAEGQSLTGP